MSKNKTRLAELFRTKKNYIYVDGKSMNWIPIIFSIGFANIQICKNVGEKFANLYAEIRAEQELQQ